MMHFTGYQLRAGRALVRLTAEKLAALAQISVVTIRRAELEDGPVSMTAANLFAVEKALLEAGVLFMGAEAGVGGPGVRLRHGFEPERTARTQRSQTIKEDNADLIAYWSQNRQLWASLSSGSKAALSEFMFGSPIAWEAEFGTEFELSGHQESP